MFNLIGIFAIASCCTEAIKEYCTPVIPAENWANKDLVHKDRMSGVSEKQIIKYAHAGRYKMNEKYPEPHRDPVDGKIIIENCKLYNEDVKNYGVVQAMKWVRQGKYNLTPEELKKEEERIDKELEEYLELARKYR